MLDLRTGIWIVRLFWWLPVRWLFRDKPPFLAGRWESTWESGGSWQYKSPTDRHSHPEVKQLGRYVYATYIARGRSNSYFGRIVGGYVIGEWFDAGDPRGYFGAYQLRIVDSERLEGMWIGHSKEESKIRAGNEHWVKLRT